MFEATQSITSMDLGKFKEKYKEQKIDRKKRKRNTISKFKLHRFFCLFLQIY